MLFNSHAFLLYFLPVALLGWALARHALGARGTLGWLLGASLFFYGWWNPLFVLLLAGSVACNYGTGRNIAGARNRADGAFSFS